MTTLTARPATIVTPEPIMHIAAGFMAAKHLFAASDLGLFEALADSPAPLDALAARTGLTRRAARISADAMVALGLLERDGDRYRNSPSAAQFLGGGGPGDLRPFLRFWDRISYPAWTALSQALASGPAMEILDLDAESQAIAAAGIEAILAGPARALPEVVDLGSCRRLLDVGGGTGSWSIAIAERHPGLRATVLDLPSVAAIADVRVDGAGLAGRVDVVGADAFVDPLPAGHDAFLVANLVHYFAPDTNRDLLRRLRAVAAPGARLLLADFWTDPTHTEPVHTALMAGEFAVHVRDGDVYSVEEVRAWLAETGWQFEAHLPLAGPQSVIVARVPLANPEQAAAWDGSEGEHWTAQADRYDAASRRYDPHLLAAAEITATSAVLDVGCGAGVSSRDAARIAIDGQILGIDLSSLLVEEARRRSGGLPNAAFVTGDAQVHAFPESAFDVAISRFGAMFFTDPVAGFANIARALRPGGRLALLAWRELERNPWVAEIRAALAAGRALPEPVPGTPGPFGLADPGAARAWLTEAGYVDVELSELREPMYLGADTEDAFSFIRGLGLARGLLAGLPGPAAQEALDILRERLAAHATPDGVLLGSSAWLITGRSRLALLATKTFP